MILWSLQPLTVAQQLQQGEAVVADAKLGDCYFAPYYRWMRVQYARKTGNSWREDLWWAFTKRPDLRYKKWQFEQETVLLKLNVPDDLVLLHYYELWHCIVCDDAYLWFNSQNDKEADEFIDLYGQAMDYFQAKRRNDEKALQKHYSAYLAYKEKNKMARKLWHKIFDFQWLCQQSEYNDSAENIHAVFQTIKPEYVQDIIPIKAKWAKKHKK